MEMEMGGKEAVDKINIYSSFNINKSYLRIVSKKRTENETNLSVLSGGQTILKGAPFLNDLKHVFSFTFVEVSC